MGKYVIYLIEDCKKNAQEAIQKLEEMLSRYNDDDNTFCIKWLQGSDEKKFENQEYFFYQPEILDCIAQKIDEEKDSGNKMGLLLDVLLTQDDLEKTVSSYYAKASIAKDIYERYCEQLPIYIFTSIAAFGSQSTLIMGTDLSDRYINYRNLIKGQVEDFDRLFSYYESFYVLEGVAPKRKRGQKAGHKSV